jgi:chitosanase
MVQVSSFEKDLYFGISFASVRRGTLYQLLEDYCREPGAKFTDILSPYLGRLHKKDQTLNVDGHFHKTLKTAAGEDPAMIRIQDRMFDAQYWQPAVANAAKIGIRTPLGVTAVFDTIISTGIGQHANMTALTSEQLDGTPITGINEKDWVRVYLENRRKTLASSPAGAGLVYRVDEILRLVDQGNWWLDGPLEIRGKPIP